MARPECDTPYAPIGMPVGDRRAYILDAALDIISPVGRGEPIWAAAGWRAAITAAGMTAERFVPDPSPTVPGARLYRTGDLGARGVGTARSNILAAAMTT